MLVLHSYKDKEVQRDAKMVSYKVVDKVGKPYVEVTIADEKKVRTSSKCARSCVMAGRQVAHSAWLVEATLAISPCMGAACPGMKCCGACMFLGVPKAWVAG